MYKHSKRSNTGSIIKEWDSFSSNIGRDSVVETLSGGQQEAEEQRRNQCLFGSCGVRGFKFNYCCVCLPTFENAKILTCLPLIFDVEHCIKTVT